jgi:hypothetical protein
MRPHLPKHLFLPRLRKHARPAPAGLGRAAMLIWDDPRQTLSACHSKGSVSAIRDTSVLRAACNTPSALAATAAAVPKLVETDTSPHAHGLSLSPCPALCCD